MSSNISKSVLVIAAFVLAYVGVFMSFEAADGSYVGVGPLLESINCPKMWKSLCKFIISLVVLVPVAWIVSKKENVLKAFGVSRGIVKALAFCGVCVLPMLICGLIFGTFEYSWETFIAYALSAGIVEEGLYRSFLFGMLFRYCNWRFWFAALPTAIIFSLGHFYQAHDWLSCLQVFGVTAFGSIFFSWLYVAWGYNLFVPIFLHTFMNAMWGMFQVDDVSNSVGSVATNTGRVLTLLLAVFITCWYRKRNGEEHYFIVSNNE